MNRSTCIAHSTRSIARLALLALLATIGGALLPMTAQAQDRPASSDSARVQRPAEGGLYLTVFRNPASGLEYRRGAFAVHGGFYPTILKADGQTEGENTNFLRAGLSTYRRPRGFSPYGSVALLVSLDDDWDNGIISEVGFRAPFARRFAARLGVGVLTSFDGEVRVNPTVGLDVRLGGR